MGAFNQTLGKCMIGGIIGAAVLVGGFLAPMNSAGRVLADTTCTGKTCSSSNPLSPGSNTINFPPGCGPSKCPSGLTIVVPPTKATITVTWSSTGTFNVKITGGRPSTPIVFKGIPKQTIEEFVKGSWVPVTDVIDAGVYRLVNTNTKTTTVGRNGATISSLWPKPCTGVCPASLKVSVPKSTANPKSIQPTDKVRVAWDGDGSFNVSVMRGKTALKSWSPAITVNVPAGRVLQVLNPKNGKWTKVTSISGPGTYRLH